MTELPWESGQDLILAASIKPTWVVKPWVATKNITELTGVAKEAGKSTFVWAMCKSVLTGQPFMGEPVEKGVVLYMTEQNASSFAIQTAPFGILGHPDFYVLRWVNAHEMSWAEAAKKASQDALSLRARLLVVDTLPHWAKFRGEDENRSGAALEAVQPLIVLAANDVGVIFVRHSARERAGFGAGQAGRGSTAFAGSVDLLLDIWKPESTKDDNIRIITSLGRFEETPSGIAVQFDKNTYTYKAVDKPKRPHPGLKEKILELLPKDEEGALTVAEIEEELGAGESTIYRILNASVREGESKKLGGGKGDPARYFSAI